MIPIPDEENTPSMFGVTQDDLDQAAGTLEHLRAPQPLKVLALGIIHDRLEHGYYVGQALTGDVTHEDPVHLWDPAGEWQAGDVVLLVHDRFGNSKFEVFLGEIEQVGLDSVNVRIDELDIVLTIPRDWPASVFRTDDTDSESWPHFLSGLTEWKLRSENLDEQALGILLQHGPRLLPRLAAFLRQDARFIGLEGSWALRQTLPRMNNESLQAIHHFLLQNPGATLGELVSMVPDRPTADDFLMKMSVQSTMLASPDRFQNVGTPARPCWKALLPAHDKACVIHVAFDPQTLEILCRPGQRLSQKKVKRLQELNLYAHVVTFPEWTQPAHQQ